MSKKSVKNKNTSKDTIQSIGHLLAPKAQPDQNPLYNQLKNVIGYKDNYIAFSSFFLKKYWVIM